MSQLIGLDQRLGAYRVFEKIGSGGFGVVYKAEDSRTGGIVALKVPHHQNRGIDYLTHEPSVLAGLEHPNIVRFIEATRENDIFFFVMEYIEGESLSDRLDRDRMIDWKEAVGIIRQVCSAIQFAHQHRVLHRDLRPANILVGPDQQIKVTDFGIAKTLTDTEYAHTVIGSPPYMAPEQLEGRATFASDLYSIGVIFYELTTGMLPFYDVNFMTLRKKILQGRCASPHQLNPSIPTYISRFIMRSMHRFRTHRFQNADEFLQGLDIAMRNTGRRARVVERLPELEKVRPAVQSRRTCWNCFQPLHTRTRVCPSCGEGQD